MAGITGYMEYLYFNFGVDISEAVRIMCRQILFKPYGGI